MNNESLNKSKFENRQKTIRKFTEMALKREREGNQRKQEIRKALRGQNKYDEHLPKGVE